MSGKIGKNIFSILTTGMYRDPRMIYREYVQNSADQIDELSADEKEDGIRKTINIDIDPDRRRVSIRDVATGIPRADFEDRLLDIADSRKDPTKNKGFRGIGRLAGLSYCKKLIFEASAHGEDCVSRLEMDCDKLREILRDLKNRSTASKVITDISTITYTKKNSPVYECWFEVILEGVDKSLGGELLDVESVKEFLSQIAPVPFSRVNFSLSKQIYEYAEEHNFPIEEYTVRVNGATVTKPYKDDIRDKDGASVEMLKDIVFDQITHHGTPLAWMWIAPNALGTQLVGSQNKERGLRLRKSNIQIGFHDFLNEYFPEPRSNGYMVGEVHILSTGILPNGDRNGLAVSPEATAFIKVFQQRCRQMWASARVANALASAKAKVKSTIERAKALEKLKKNADVPQDVIKNEQDLLEKAFKEAEKKVSVLKKSKDADTASDNQFISVVARVATADLSDVEKDLSKAVKLADKPVETVDTKRQRCSGRETGQPSRNKNLASEVISILIEKAGLEIPKALEVWELINEKIQG